MFLKYFYNLDVNPLSGMNEIFSLSVTFHFVWMTVVLALETLFTFMMSNSSIFDLSAGFSVFFSGILLCQWVQGYFTQFFFSRFSVTHFMWRSLWQVWIYLDSSTCNTQLWMGVSMKSFPPRITEFCKWRSEKSIRVKCDRGHQKNKDQ